MSLSLKFLRDTSPLPFSMRSISAQCAACLPLATRSVPPPTPDAQSRLLGAAKSTKPVGQREWGSCDEESSARLIEENLKQDFDIRADSTIDEPSSRLATFKQKLLKKEREWGSDDDLSAARLEAENLNHAMERAAESEDEETTRARPVTSPVRNSRKSRRSPPKHETAVSLS